MNKNEDLVGKFIRQAKIEEKVTPSVASKKDRVHTGLIVGMLTGATYSGIAHAINLIQAPGIPLFFHPFGIMGNIIYTILMGGLAGIAIALNDKAILSISIGSVIIILGTIVYQLFSLKPPLLSFAGAASSTSTLLAVGGAIGVIAPVTGLMRWVTDVQLEKPHLKFWHSQRLLSILVLACISGFAGYLHKMSGAEVLALETANKLILEEALCIPEYSYNNDHYQLEVKDILVSDFYFDPLQTQLTGEKYIVVKIYFDKGQTLAYLINLNRTPDCAIKY